ncbi:MAG: M48 family metalloprotease [Gammaproteobacteria bacterium]|nr:M48 family metalloprotease [Gammaproteobacteria bacterium]MBQ0839295.1 M48 family metalloprotease [Gammaproteobacteria bacterium]
MPRKRLISLTIALLLTLGCTVNPVTGERQLSLVSAEQEVSIGRQQYLPAQQAQGGRYYLDPEIQFYVASIGKKLAAVSDRPNLPYEFVVLNNSVPNAWALPGGKIAINRGLLMHLEDESELAAVLSHEIVHAAARHSAAQMTRGTLINIGAQALGAASQNNGFGELGGMAAQLSSAAWMASYGRGAELESDAYGMEYMVRAGYDPRGAVKLQETFVKLSEGRQSDFLSALFASHPPSQARVAANKEKVKTYPPGGITNRARFQKKIARLLKDQPAYKAQTEAMKALANKKPQQALQYLDSAVAQQSGEGQFWELRGHAWVMLDKPTNADKAYSTAIAKNPDYFSHYLARGVLRFKRGQKIAAAKDLDKSQNLLPTPVASLYLGDISRAGGDEKTALTFYREAAQTQGEIGQEARDKLAIIEMSRAPNRYILNRLSLSSDGYLLVSVYNKSNIPTTGVVVQVTEMTSTYVTGPSMQIAIGALSANTQKTVATRIGPIEGEAALNRYRALVIAAQAVAP